MANIKRIKLPNENNARNIVDDSALRANLKGVANGVAELGSDGKVPSSQLPSYVDDVLEYNSKSEFPTTGESGKIYVDKSTNLTWRWSGTTYVEISPSLALGETSSTAYRGDRGKIAYDHSKLTSGNPHNVTKSDVGLGNVGNFKAVSTVASQGLTSTEQKNARDNIDAAAMQHTHSSSQISGLSTVATSGNYNDLNDKPIMNGKTPSGGIDEQLSGIVIGNKNYKIQDISKEVEYTLRKVSSITDNLSDVKYPTTNAVYNYVNDVVGDIESLLAAI